MTCHFHVGQKVVCVDDVVWFKDGGVTNVKSGLEKGRIYTVSNIYPIPTLYYRGEIGGFVAELVETTAPGEWKTFLGYSVKRFRPVAERKTDISVFKAMLNYKPKLVVMS